MKKAIIVFLAAGLAVVLGCCASGAVRRAPGFYIINYPFTRIYEEGQDLDLTGLVVEELDSNGAVHRSGVNVQDCDPLIRDDVSVAGYDPYLVGRKQTLTIIMGGRGLPYYYRSLNNRGVLLAARLYDGNSFDVVVIPRLQR